MTTRLTDDSQILRYELYLAGFDGVTTDEVKEYMTDLSERWIEPDGWDALLATELRFQVTGKKKRYRNELSDLVAGQTNAPLALRAYTFERSAAYWAKVNPQKCILSSFVAISAAQRLSERARQIIVAHTQLNIWEGGPIGFMDDEQVEDDLRHLIDHGAYRAPRAVLWWVNWLLHARPPDTNRRVHATTFLVCVVKRSHHSLAHAFNSHDLNRCKELLAKLEREYRTL